MHVQWVLHHKEQRMKNVVP